MRFAETIWPDYFSLAGDHGAGRIDGPQGGRETVPARSIRWRCWSTCSRGPARSRSASGIRQTARAGGRLRISTIRCSSGWRRWPPNSTCRPTGGSHANRRSTSANGPTWPAWARFAGSPLRPRAGRGRRRRQAVSLDRFRGKPVVIIFYLGSGCLHCVEQLQKFAPLARRVRGGGHLDRRHQQRAAGHADRFAGQAVAQGPIPFPLGADPDMCVFKATAYDDFEKMPLHATYLVDAEGRSAGMTSATSPSPTPSSAGRGQAAAGTKVVRAAVAHREATSPCCNIPSGCLPPRPWSAARLSFRRPGRRT